MQFRLKNDDGIELHLSLQERELFFDALRYYSAYDKDNKSIDEKIVNVCQLLNVLHLPEFDKKICGRAKQTNYDKIKNMSVHQMAEYLYTHDDSLNDKICKSAHKECPFGDNVESKNCIECVRQWLESEATE